ncbi:ATP-dependent DNA ligase [Sphingobium sp. AN558]|uniref:ATP-dependent DNA ligase n=1 Tax=Sphingobium sp. AN558 TaxID=3133442 RepID=UPI0030C4D8EA
MNAAPATAFDQLQPMEAKLVESLPNSPGWQYEPKWDGFRALILKNGATAAIKSKSGKPLGRYFPELMQHIEAIDLDTVILDGEIVLPLDGVLSFDALQARLHPAASRIARLSRESPAQLILFDCLWTGADDLTDAPLDERRAALVDRYARITDPSFQLSPASLDATQAQKWLDDSGGALDGVIAKPRDQGYRPGERAMLKMKRHRTADCVVGGFRTASDSDAVASLLLGLYDGDGKLNHVGFVSGFHGDQRAALAERLAPLIGGTGFTGKTPGGPSRWATGRSVEWVPLAPRLVVEVLYDQVTNARFRHGTRFLRWRPDKAPEQCGLDQLDQPVRPAELTALMGAEG